MWNGPYSPAEGRPEIGPGAVACAQEARGGGLRQAAVSPRERRATALTVLPDERPAPRHPPPRARRALGGEVPHRGACGLPPSGQRGASA